MNKIAIMLIAESSLRLAKNIQTELAEQYSDASICIYHKGELEGTTPIDSVAEKTKELFANTDALIFIGAMGICVRSIAPMISDKHTDPAVVCIDSTSKFIIPVLSGHVGGANDLSRLLSSITGGTAVVTTQSDNTGLWALDTLAQQYGWRNSLARKHQSLNRVISLFVAGKPTALILDADDEGSKYLRETAPEHVTVFRFFSDYRFQIRRKNISFAALIIVSPRLYPTQDIPTLQFFPRTLHLGVGCQKLASTTIAQQLLSEIRTAGFSPESIATIGSIELKKDEPLLAELQKLCPRAHLRIYSAEELSKVKIPNPSDKVFEVTGCYGVAESAALIEETDSKLVIEKQKSKVTIGDKIQHYTFALAQSGASKHKGHIEIVGAGPGDPDLISVRGRKFLQDADLILYAGSLVPRKLTNCHKPNAVVRSSASMSLEEQFELMKEFYDKGLLVVRLHTGDPCIYGAIQEQMNYFDEYGMDYHITPGISSFLAAAAELRSQFTIPEKTQTIILTRGEGRTPMPEKEQLHKLAQSQSTMCIFLSASIVDKVQEELLQAYPPETPVAACYRLTWPDQRIYRGQLKDLAKIIHGNKLTLTTMIVVGEAIDNRHGLSKLYDKKFTHLFREGK